MKLAILGFDGLDSKLFESTNLPTLSRIRNAGQWGALWSEEMRTAPCWSSVLTGWNIGAHGITHLTGYPYEGSNWFNGRPHDYIFDGLACKGYAVGVANFPSLCFARRIPTPEREHWMIGGWPGQPNIWPTKYSHLLDGLYSDLPDYEERVLAPLRPAGAQKDWSIHEWLWSEYIHWVANNARLRLSIIKQLPQVDVLMIQESVADRAGHMLSTKNKGQFGTEDPRYHLALELIEDLITSVIVNYNPEFLAICSDHGFEGRSEADPKKGCWHSHRGVWALVGPDVYPVRNDTDQVNFTPTILDALGIDIKRDGQSCLLRSSEYEQVDERLRALGYE